MLGDAGWDAGTGDEGLDAWQERLRSAPGRIGIWTSGTTGQPQHVEHSAASLLRGIQGGAKHRHDVWGCTYAPGSYAFWQVILQALFNRNPIVDLYRLGPTETLAQINDQSVTHLSGTPTFFRRLDEAGAPCSTVRAVTTGGEPLDSRALTAIRRQFPAAKIRNVYASTQAGVLLTSDSDVFTIPAHRRDEFAIVDRELAIHRRLLGTFVNPRNDEPTGARDEFYWSGDLVDIVTGDVTDETSALTIRFIGRSSAVIHVGGTKVSPERVEAAILARVPQVQAARVYGVDNSVTGQIVACEVVLDSDAQDMNIANFRERLQEELRPAEIPRIVTVVEEITVTAAGKVKRGGR